MVDDITPSYSLQFHLSEVNKPTKLPAEIRQVQLSMSNADRLALNFEERVRIVIRNIIIDAMPVQ